jgi:hypothetical protein
MELAPVHFSRFDYIRDYRFLDPAPLAPKAVRLVECLVCFGRSFVSCVC